MQVNSTLNGIRRRSLLAIDDNAVSFQQHILQEVGHIFLFFDNAFSDYLTSHGSNIVHIGIPELESGLFLEPFLADQETIDNARAVVGMAVRLRIARAV